MDRYLKLGRARELRTRPPVKEKMDFAIPEKTQKLLAELDAFIEDVIKPIEQEDDNIRFFDHRREDSRTDWDRNGLPNADWENLLKRMRQEALSLIHI